MSMKVQGSQLFYADPDTDDVVEVGCVTSIDGLTASREQVDVTCITDEARRNEAGLLVPGAATFGIFFDAANAGHIRLHELYRTGVQMKWALGLSDGTAEPTVVDSNGNFNLPSTRTFITFEGYLSDFPWSLQIGQKIANNLSLQISDFPLLTPKA